MKIMKRKRKKRMNEKLKVSDGLKVWIQDFLDSSAPQFKGKSPKERIKMAIAAFTDAGGKLKEGNMKERMDQSKLTGQEISVYFRKNPKAGKDKLVKKAVEFALDHGGAMSYAIKGIEKMKRGLTKHPEVKKALRYANESVHHESVWMMKGIISENYTRNFETLCQSLKLNGIQQKILDDFIHKGRIRDQYVGRAAGSKKETRIFAGKKKFSGSIDNRSEALMNALKVNAKQKSILDAYLKTGKVIGKYTGSIAGSTKDTKSYAGFRGFKEHFEIEEKVGTMYEQVLTQLETLLEKPYDDADVKKVKQLEKKLEKMLKEVDKTMRCSGLSAPAFSMVRGCIVKGLESIKKFYKIAAKIPMKKMDYESFEEQVSFAFDTMKAAKAFQKKADGKPVNIVKVGTGKYYVVELRPDLTQNDREHYAKVAVKIGISESFIPEGRYGKSMSRKDIMRKHGNEFKKALRSNSLDLSDKAEGDLIQYVMDNHPEEIRTDDPDEWIEWLDDNLEDFVKGRGY